MVLKNMDAAFVEELFSKLFYNYYISTIIYVIKYIHTLICYFLNPKIESLLHPEPITINTE